MWWHKLWPLTPLIIVALVVACLIAVIILICIIICMCRRRRKRSSKSKSPSELAFFSEIAKDKKAIHEKDDIKINPHVRCYNFISFSFFLLRAGMEKSLVDNKPYDPNAEPCENYENLPFHGLQNPPTKVSK